MMIYLVLLFQFYFLFKNIRNSQCCVTFICVNYCGSSNYEDRHLGYKLILANNRDEEINRHSLSAHIWPPQRIHSSSESVDNGYFAYGPLDVARGFPPQLYSSWLAINSYGNAANLLFYMKNDRHVEKKARGTIVANYILTNTREYNSSAFLDDLQATKRFYKDFNLVLLEMSEVNGSYSLYYINNNDLNTYEKMNKNEQEQFIFGLSNSNPDEPFRKVTTGETIFNDIINEHSENTNKQQLIDSMFNQLLSNTTPLYPDENLAKFMDLGLNDEHMAVISNVSSINAKYTSYWPGARTRTQTLILVDYNNVVEYYEFNLTVYNDTEEIWTTNNYTFKLRPMYLYPDNSNIEIRQMYFKKLLVIVFISMLILKQ